MGEPGCLLVVIYPSGKQAFAGTRTFYERSGYEASSRVPDFYGPGDDLVKFYRTLTNGKGPGGNGRTPEPKA